MKNLYFLVVVALMTLSGCGGGGGSSTAESSPVDTSTKFLRVACVGDSITQGYKLSNPSTQSYPAQLAGLVGADVSVGNFGISGRTVLKSASPSYFNSSQYQQSLGYSPDVVVIMLGTNDMKDANFGKNGAIVNDYTALIQSYKALASQPTVYICFPPPSYGSFRGITNSRITNTLIPKIREVASANGVGIIDIHSALSGKKELFPDTLHPNTEGARQIALKVYETIY